MLNQRTLDAARKRKSPCHLWASSPSGFGARVMGSGSASFIFAYRAGSGRHARKRTLTLGSANNLAVDQARAIALRHAAAVAAGQDPAFQRDETRVRQAAAKGETIALLVPAFIRQHHHARGHRQAKEVQRTLTADAVRRWGAKPACDIAPTDISRLLREVTERGAPGQARRLYLALSRFFRWSVENHFVASSPMTAVAKPVPPRPRDRVLTDHEIGLLWKACDSVHSAYAACIRLMVLTGCRRNEAARARWDEFDLSAATWNLPASRSKNKRAHITYLPQQAVDLLGQLPRLGEFVFTTRDNIPLAGFSKVRAALQLRMVASAIEMGAKPPSDDWVFHDLRRSLVSWLAGNGVAVHFADRLLNHVTGSFSGVLGTYQRYEFIVERRDALAAWGRHIENLASGIPTASNVMMLSAA